jgi:hypothetical protein
MKDNGGIKCYLIARKKILDSSQYLSFLMRPIEPYGLGL